MKKILLSCVLSCLSLVSMADTLTIRQLFIEMPDTLIPYLTRNNRLDFVDFMDSKMKAEVTNLLGGKSEMTALTDDSLSIRLNDACKVDMLLLPVSEAVDSCSQVVAMVRTVGLETENTDTEVDYFSCRWRQIFERINISQADEERLKFMLKSRNITEIITEKLNKH